MGDKYRLITRSDFDGLVCAMILKELDLIDDIKFVHPKAMQDGLIEVKDKVIELLKRTKNNDEFVKSIKSL